MERSEIISKLCKEAAETTPDVYDKILNAARAQGIIDSPGTGSAGASSAANAGSAVKAVAKTASKGKIAAIAVGTLAALIAVTAVVVPLAFDNDGDAGGLQSAEGDNNPGSGGDPGSGNGSEGGSGSESGNGSEGGNSSGSGSGSEGGGDTENGVYNGLKYTLGWDGTYYKCAGFDGAPASEAVVASEYNGKPVTHIGDGAFDRCAELTKVILPDSVTWIGHDAFAFCVNLTDINLDKITRIDAYAFDSCAGMTSLKLTGAADRFVFIDNNAFARSGVTEVIFNEYVGCGSEAFRECENLTTATVYTDLKDRLFADCHKLETLYLGCSIFGKEVFARTPVHDITFAYDVAAWNAGMALSDENWNAYTWIAIDVHCTDGSIIIPVPEDPQY